MAAIVDEIYYGCKTNYVEKCVKQGIKIIRNNRKYALMVIIAIRKLLQNIIAVNIFWG